jgi:hypothetical protein
MKMYLLINHKGSQKGEKNIRFINLEELCMDSNKLLELGIAELKGTSLKRVLRNAIVNTLFVKTEDGGKFLIVSLYIDDLIFT